MTIPSLSETLRKSLAETLVTDHDPSTEPEIAILHAMRAINRRIEQGEEGLYEPTHAGDRLALVDGNFRAEVWDVATGQSLQTFASELSPIIFGEFNTTGERLTLAYRGSDLGVYDIARGVRISPPMRHLYQSNALVVSADGSRSATSSWDGRVIVWNSTDGGMVMEPVMQPDRETPSMDLCRDGSRILLSQRARNAQPQRTGSFSCF
jgi:WD40 repeat protein